MRISSIRRGAVKTVEWWKQMKMIVFCLCCIFFEFADYFLVLHFNKDPYSSDGLLLRAFILTYLYGGYQIKEKSK